MSIREINKRINEYTEKEMDYLVGNRVTGHHRKLLKQVIVLGQLLEKFCFIESGQHLKAARDYMVRDLRKMEYSNIKESNCLHKVEIRKQLFTSST